MEKKPWQSKTVWMNLILAVCAMAFPPAVKYISENPLVVTMVFSGVNIVLRLLTKDGISIE